MIRSMCPVSMISGGDSATVSPVVRTSTPCSKQSRNTWKARLVGIAGYRGELDAADQADVADVDDMGQPRSECTAASK
jgi:hypothetical protein